MRTAGILLMDTPMPDGRIMIRPQDFFGGGTLQNTVGIPNVSVTGGAIQLVAALPGALLRYGMSDDAQQNFGMGAPGSLGFQGAQAQVVATGQPFITPYGPSGRPPQPSSNFGKPTVSRPKGLKPMAVTTVYSVAGGALTALSVGLVKVNFTAGVAPALISILPTTNLAFPATTLDVITTPIPVANQNFLNDPFDGLNLILTVDAGAATFDLYGAFVDFAFNFN